MFDDVTPESLRAAILANLADTWQTREGSFAANLAAPAAMELWKFYQALSGMVGMFYVDESSGGYIDLAAGTFGLTRKAGVNAAASMTFTGTAGTVIPAGTAFLTEGGVEFDLLEAVTLDAAGAGAGTARAAEAGESGNVSAGSLTRMIVTISGLNSWTNGAASGGVDAESDADLCRRYYNRLQTPATSGNAYHYRKWALEVSGVGDVKVFPLWNGAGTVKVLLVGPDKAPVESGVVSAAKNNIESQRPIGADVTVASAQGVTVAVAAAVTLDGSVSAAGVQTAFAAALEEYLKSVAFSGGAVLYNRIAFLLLSVSGVTDYTALTVNGGTANVALTDDQVPVLGAVTVT
ncbi:MAG: baseplate J/gp47 family protein [Pseudoflavonifractor sp.]|nr:baseplate J/gp47 family protein [Pseudoflavonifractor sp.]